MLTISDYIQLSISFTTFLAVIVALFGERFWRWKERPNIELSFDSNSDRCFRWAYVHRDNIQDDGQFKITKRQYFRLKVINNGGPAIQVRVRADILNEKGQELERFEPSTLLWITGSESVDLARGESEYVNFISQVLEPATGVNNRFRVEVYNASERGIAWDRPLGSYKFKITVHGNNFSPKLSTAIFKPSKNNTQFGNLKVYKC